MLTVEVRIKAEHRTWPLALLTKTLSLSLSVCVCFSLLVCIKVTQDCASFSQSQSLAGVRGGRIQQYSQRMGVSVRVCAVWFVCAGGSFSKRRWDVFNLTSLVAILLLLQRLLWGVYVFQFTLCASVCVCLQPNLNPASEALGLVFPMQRDRKWRALLNCVSPTAAHTLWDPSFHLCVCETERQG